MGVSCLLDRGGEQTRDFTFVTDDAKGMAGTFGSNVLLMPCDVTKDEDYGKLSHRRAAGQPFWRPLPAPGAPPTCSPETDVCETQMILLAVVEDGSNARPTKSVR